jgi:hypothetical protein
MWVPVVRELAVMGGEGGAGLRAASGNSVAPTLRRDSDNEHALSRPMK